MLVFNIKKFALPSIAGIAIGAGIFFGFRVFADFASEKSKDVEVRPAGPSDIEEIVGLGDDTYFYKPLSRREPEIPKEGKFVHADLQLMTVKLYENGALAQELPIATKGRPGSLWQTPTGEYKALTKEENHFSSIGKVWMPYSIAFFGNFFIHGWPYYASGEPVASTFSGGCIRLKDEYAKIVYDFIDRGTPIVVTDEKSGGIKEKGYQPLKHSNPPRISASSLLVADIDNGHVFLERNRTVVRPIASITKLMTGIIALEAVSSVRDITIKGEDLEIHGDSGELVRDEVYTSVELLDPLLLSSSNDAAYALARSIGISYFVDLMNKKAAALRLVNTRFTDPSGLEMTNVSTVEDLVYLIKYIRDSRQPLLDISRKRTVTKTTNKATHTWRNFNWKSDDPAFVGGKVGYIDAAGHTMVALFRLQLSEFETRDIAIAVLDSEDHQGDIKKLADWVSKNFVYGATPTETADVISGPQFAATNDTYSMLFVGDIMMNRGVEKVINEQGKGDFLYPFYKIRDTLASADLTFGNLEGPISDKGRNVGSIYSFRMDSAVTKALYDVGFDIVSLANNHMGDYTIEAFEDTMRRLRGAGLAFTGAGWNRKEALLPTILVRGGKKIGFLGFTDVGPNWLEVKESTSGILIAKKDVISEAIRQARDKVDILIVSFHYGEEYKIKSNARQQELSRFAIDEGADIVIGHHPHVAEEIERYKGKLIAYSLGNFIFDQAFSEDTKKALMLKVTMKGNAIERVEELPITFNETYQPELKK